MRGGFVHNLVMVATLAADALSVGCEVAFEVAVKLASSMGFIDIVIRKAEMLISVEAERSARRIMNDLKKAEAIDADELWLVVPTARVACTVRRRLAEVELKFEKPRIFVLTLGQARQRLALFFPLNSVPND